MILPNGFCLSNLDGVNNHNFSEYTIDFEAGTVDVNDLIVLEKGTIDLPVHNSQYDTKASILEFLLIHVLGMFLEPQITIQAGVVPADSRSVVLAKSPVTPKKEEEAQ